MAIRTKLSRQRDQRRALLKGLATSLIEYQAITTTKPRARAVTAYVERLITKAKKGDLANRRRVIASLSKVSVAHKLVDQIAPQLDKRQSGYLRRRPVGFRRGDNSHLYRVSFVDQIKKSGPEPAKSDSTKPAAKIGASSVPNDPVASKSSVKKKKQ